jgi:hypothetical protein
VLALPAGAANAASSVSILESRRVVVFFLLLKNRKNIEKIYLFFTTSMLEMVQTQWRMHCYMLIISRPASLKTVLCG